MQGGKEDARMAPYRKPALPVVITPCFISGEAGLLHDCGHLSPDPGGIQCPVQDSLCMVISFKVRNRVTHRGGCGEHCFP